PGVVPAPVSLGGGAEADPARPRQSARHALDGPLGVGRRHPRYALGRIDRLLRLARVHPHAHPRGRVAVQPRGHRDDGLHRSGLMTRRLWLGAEVAAVALVLALLALLVWRVVTDSNQSVAQSLNTGQHPTAPVFDLKRLAG